MSGEASETTTQEITINLDRIQAVSMMFAEGLSFAAMVPVLHKLDLLTCRETHHMRRQRDGQVCATCEDTVQKQWKRHLASLGSDDPVIEEVRGAWLQAHFTVAEICKQRYIQSIEIVTETTNEAGAVTSRTIRKETRINATLLRLWLETQDKLVRMAGVDLDDPDAASKVPRSKVHVNRASTGPVN